MVHNVLVSVTVILSALGVLCKDEQRIIQDSFVVASEGKEGKLKCSHATTAAHENIYWYRQFPNQSPSFLVYAYKDSEVIAKPKGILTVAQDRKSSVLSINRVTLEDSAVYFCILSDTVMRSGAPAVQ